MSAWAVFYEIVPSTKCLNPPYSINSVCREEYFIYQSPINPNVLHFKISNSNNYCPPSSENIDVTRGTTEVRTYCITTEQKILVNL